METQTPIPQDRQALTEFVHSVMTEELERFVRKNEDRAREFSLLERMVRVEEALQSQGKVQESLQREMNKRFEAMDGRFEAMGGRFEAMGGRFVSLQREMDKRFEAMDKRFEAMDKRFEAMDGRFVSLQREMDKRFEATDKRFESVEKRLTFLQWSMVTGFAFLSILVTLINFLR